MLNDKTTWHGLTDQEVVAKWDRHAWRGRVVSTLIAIAENPRALAAQRVAALHMLNENIASGVLEPKYLSFPDFILAILQSITCGTDKNVGWRARRAQKKIEEQLTGANYLLRFAGQFIQDKRAFQTRGNATPALDALLS